MRQGINSLIILRAWTLWNHRNGCVFDGAAPNLAGALILAGEDRRLWSIWQGLEDYLSWLPSSPVVRVSNSVVVVLCVYVTGASVILETVGA